ncbi:MAG: hypothetical protein MK137_06370 [Rickettsiales bacterium]|nr:hypothetical protein [Rickettsiales bacterium]
MNNTNNPNQPNNRLPRVVTPSPPPLLNRRSFNPEPEIEAHITPEIRQWRTFAMNRRLRQASSNPQPPGAPRLGSREAPQEPPHMQL